MALVAILHLAGAAVPGAMRTAEELAVGLHAVADDAATA